MSVFALAIALGFLTYLIKLSATLKTSGRIKAGGEKSERFGFQFELPKKGWFNDPIPCGAARIFENHGGLIVIPIILPGAMNNETLAAAFFAAVSMKLKDANSGKRQAINFEGISGTQFEFNITRQNQDEVWNAKILRGTNFAFFLAAYVKKNAEKKLPLIVHALECTKIKEPDLIPVLLPSEQTFHRFFFNNSGLHLMDQGDYTAALNFFRKSLDLEFDNVVLMNLCLAAHHGGMKKIGYDEIVKYKSNYAGTPEILCMQARFERDLGYFEQSEETFRKLLTSGFDDDEIVREFAQLLWQQNKKDEALSIAKERVEKTKSASSKLLLASIQAQTKPDEALAIINEVLTNDKENIRALIQKIETLTDSGRYTDSIGEINGLIHKGYEYPYIYFLKGRSELGLSLLKEAQQSLDIAKKGMPNDEGAIALHNHVTGLLGQGNRNLIKDPIEPLPLPIELLKVWEASDKGFDPSPFEAYYTIVGKVFELKKNERLRTTEYGKLEITGPEGARMYTVLQLPFDPLHEKAFINELTVTTPTGQSLKGNPESYFVTDNNSDGVSSHKQILHIPVPGLTPGATMRFVVTRQANFPATTIPFRTDAFSCRVPAKSSFITLKGDLDKLNILVPESCEKIEKPNERTFSLQLPVPAVAESMSPPYLSAIPAFRFSETSSSWQTVAAEYAQRVEREFDTSNVSTVIESINAVAKTDEEKIAAVGKFLQGEIRYIAIEFGSRGIEPASPAETLARKYGDCKDQAVLGITILRGLGIKAWPCLVNTEAPIAIDMPSLDQFNHMVIFISEKFFYDPTQRYFDPLLSPPVNLGGKWGLVLQNKPELVEIPPYSPNSSEISIRRQVHRDGQNLLADETTVFYGYLAGSMRAFLANVPVDMHMKALQDTFNSLGLPMRFKFAQVQELQNPAKPLVLESSLEMMRSVTEGAYPSVLPFMSWESYFIEIRAVGVRRLPFELPYPMKLISESQYQISGAQSDKDSGQNKFCRYSSEIEPSGNSFTLRFDCETNSIKGNADEFTTLHRMSQQAISRFHKPIPFQAS